jgi:phage recombination protein Bet
MNMMMPPSISGAPVTLSPRVDSLTDRNLLTLVRLRNAKTLNDSEFNIFVHHAKTTGLDPLKNQIFAYVFSADKPDKRQMAIVIGINGYRAMAHRTGDYLPSDAAPKITKRKTLVSEINPKGLIKAAVIVRVYRHGEWHNVMGVVSWDEIAPIEGSPNNRYIKSGSPWLSKPEFMLAKCAEVAALRKAFPDIFSNVYEENEIDKAKTLDLPPSEFIRQGDNPYQEPKAPAKPVTLTVDWLEDGPLAAVPVAEFADRVFEFIDQNVRLTPLMVQQFRERNRHTLAEYFHHDAGRHHKLIARFEDIAEKIRAVREHNAKRTKVSA